MKGNLHHNCNIHNEKETISVLLINKDKLHSTKHTYKSTRNYKLQTPIIKIVPLLKLQKMIHFPTWILINLSVSFRIYKFLEILLKAFSKTPEKIWARIPHYIKVLYK